jgi:hypothetical protein
MLGWQTGQTTLPFAAHEPRDWNFTGGHVRGSESQQPLGVELCTPVGGSVLPDPSPERSRYGMPRRLRVTALLVLPVALAIAAVGFFLYAGAALPYQDPTPELLNSQAKDIRTSQMLLFGGLLVFIVDAIWLWRTRPGRR